MAAANERFRVKLHPTALATDVLFYHVVDGRLGKNDTPAYGTPYHEALSSAPEGFNDHKLVHIAPAGRSQSPGEELWYFAAPRLTQDLYNFEHSQADIGGTRFDSVKRSYIDLRSAYNPVTPAQGAAMADSPADLFTGSYVLAERQQASTGDEILDSLYVAEVRVYVKRTTLADISTDRVLGVGVKKTLTHYFRGEILIAGTPGTAIETAAADPTNAYWGLQIDGTVRDVQQITSNWWVVIEISSLDAARLADVRSMPSSVKLDLPYVLSSVGLSWNIAGSNGTSESESAGRCSTVGDPRIQLNPNESASAECGGSIQPEVSPVILPPKGEPVPSIAYFFQIKQSGTGVTLAQVLARLQTICGNPSPAIALWPSFGTVSHSITLNGQRASGQASANANAFISAQSSGSEARNDKELTCGKGVSYDYASTVTTLDIRPTIHGAISIGGVGNPKAMTQNYTATCSVEWGAASDVGTIASHDTLVPVPHDIPFSGEVLDGAIGVGTLTSTATITLEASVYPETLPATTPPAIPSSNYYLDRNYRVEPADDNWFRVYAEVFNAADI